MKSAKRFEIKSFSQDVALNFNSYLVISVVHGLMHTLSAGLTMLHTVVLKEFSMEGVSYFNYGHLYFKATHADGLFWNWMNIIFDCLPLAETT